MYWIKYHIFLIWQNKKIYSEHFSSRLSPNHKSQTRVKHRISQTKQSTIIHQHTSKTPSTKNAFSKPSTTINHDKLQFHARRKPSAILTHVYIRMRGKNMSKFQHAYFRDTSKILFSNSEIANEEDASSIRR